MKVLQHVRFLIPADSSFVLGQTILTNSESEDLKLPMFYTAPPPVYRLRLCVFSELTRLILDQNNFFEMFLFSLLLELYFTADFGIKLCVIFSDILFVRAVIR